MVTNGLYAELDKLTASKVKAEEDLSTLIFHLSTSHAELTKAQAAAMASLEAKQATERAAQAKEQAAALAKALAYKTTTPIMIDALIANQVKSTAQLTATQLLAKNALLVAQLKALAELIAKNVVTTATARAAVVKKLGDAGEQIQPHDTVPI